jgi:hypothetical protein|tara:strand:- start:1281 stop:1412 length:132 start_codon:yes stop_codon:yes gene_type:complete
VFRISVEAGRFANMAAILLSHGARTTPSARLAILANHSGIRLF